MIRLLIVITIVITSIFGSTLPVFAAGPSIESVAPGMVQRGSEFTLTLVGAGLSDAKELFFYSTGVSCIELKAVSDNELAVKLKAADDCPLGTHPFRVRTARGISELKIFRVTPFPIVIATEPNETPKQAMPISGNVTVIGALEKGDLDCFQMTLRRGTRLAAEVEAVRLGERLLDTVLTIFGPDGKRLAHVDDTALFAQDPFVSLIAPLDGSYVVQVREANLEGDANSRYALHIGHFPRPSFVYPAGGPIGKKIDVRFGGDANGTLERQVQLPNSQQPEYGLFAEHQGVTSPTPIPFRVSGFENVLESEPNDDPAKLVGCTADLPIAFNGILEKSGDADCYRFRMNAGETFEFEAFADRIGSSADTVISILDSDGTILVANDDDGSHDSRVVFWAPHTGEFVLRVADQRGAGGPNFIYRVEAVVPQPGLTAFLPRPDRMSQERQAISVPRGNRVMTFLGVQRRGVNSDVQLTPQGLPAGVKSVFAMVPADRFLVPVVIEAVVDAPISGQLVRVMAAGSTSTGRTVTGEFRQVVDLVNATADRLYFAVTVDRLAIAVVDAAPFSIRLDEPKSSLVKDGTIELVVHVDRTTDFADPVEVTFPFLPPWVDGPAQITIPATKTMGVYVAHAFPQAEPRAWQVCAEARAALATAREVAPIDPIATPVPGARRNHRGKKGNDIAVASELVNLNITESPLTGTIGRVAGEQGTTIDVICSIDRHGLLPEQLEARLEGLPNRVEAGPVKLDLHDGKAKFSIQLEMTAPIGEFDSLVCRLTGTIQGQAVSYSVGRGGVLKIVPPGGLVVDANGRPLSPLEALRESEKGDRPK